MTDTLLKQGHIQFGSMERIGFIAMLIVLNAFAIAALITQDYYPRPTLAFNICLVVLSVLCFVASAMFICDEDVDR